jgi:phosphonate transport system substrate-binding protein
MVRGKNGSGFPSGKKVHCSTEIAATAMPKKIAILLLIVATFTLMSCRDSEKPVAISLDKRQEITFRPQIPAITYAYLPQYSHTESFQRHNRLVEYLAEETGLPIRQVFPDTFDNHISMFGQGKIDISFSNPFVYVKLANRFGARAMTRIVEKDGRAEFRGQIIARRDNAEIQSIDDCRDKSWVAVDPSSAGGYLFPLGHFVDQGFNLDDFREVVFAGGRQENVILGVYAGLHDIGSIREGSLRVVEDKIDINQIKVIDSSRWYPGWVYAHSPRLPAEVTEQIRAAMLKLDYENDPRHRAILDAAQFIGFVPSDDRDFAPIRELSDKVGLDLD